MSINSSVFLLQSGGLGALAGLIPLLAMVVLFYVLIIVPQRRQARKVTEMLDSLKVGDKVVTQGGIYGTITIMRDDKKTLQLRDLRQSAGQDRRRPHGCNRSARDR